MKVWFDLDGVLSSFVPNSIRVANELWPETPIPEDYTPSDYSYSDVFTAEKWSAIWEKAKTIPDFWLRQQPFEDNVSALRTWLPTTQHEVFYITSRMETGGVPAYDQTSQWLIRNGIYPPTAQLIVVPKATEKKKYIEEHKIDAGLDDLPSTVTDVNMLPWHHCFLMDRSWNQDSNQSRVSSVREFLDVVDAVEHWLDK